jgi:Flp pilus assembly protein TadG
MGMTMSMSELWYRVRLAVRDLIEDRRGLAAIEFAMLVPIMLVMFFGTVELSSGVAVDRKVTLVARTLSDLTSQSTSVDNTVLTSFFNVKNAMLTPYPATPVQATISELYVDPITLKARVQWSYGSAVRSTSSVVGIPTALAVPGTYLIMGEVSYLYVPTVGYVMAKAGINLTSTAYTRPRQTKCVIYPTPASGAALPACPTS